MGLVNLNAGHNEYISAVPASVNAALAKLAIVYLHLANMNGVLNVAMANNQMNAAKSEAAHQKEQGWAEAIGEFVMGGAQMVAGSMSVKAASDFLSGLSSNEALDTQIENATAYKKAILSRNPEVNATDGVVPENDPEEIAAVNARHQELIENKGYLEKKPEEKTTRAGSDKSVIDKLSEEQAENLLANIDESITSLNNKKSTNDFNLKVKEAKMKRMDGYGMIVQGVGQAGKSVTHALATHEMAAATIQRNLESLMGNLAQHFDQRDQSLLQDAFQPFEQLAQMAQTQVSR